MKACVLTFSPRSGTGTQTITGVVDRDGNPFVGKLFLFQSAYAAANTLTSGAWPLNLYMDSRGADTGTVRSAQVVASNDFGFKVLTGAQSLGDYSLLDFVSQLSFGGEVQRRAKITAIASGSFTMTYDLNQRTGDSVQVAVFGGDDLTIDLPNDLSNGVRTVVGPPKGVLVYPGPGLNGSGATSTATGGQQVAWGWDTPGGTRAGFCYETVLFGSQWSVQRADAMSLGLSGGVLSSNLPYVSNWGTTSLTIAGNVSAFNTGMPLVFSGSAIVTAAGRITQPTTVGTQLFTTGINTKWIMFVANGFPAASTVQTPIGQTVHGWASGTAQAGFWTGDSQPASTPSYGARYLATDSVLRFGTPNGLSTAFTSVASVASLTPYGGVSLDWTAVDGTERAIDWFAIGDAPPAPPAPDVRQIRRLRRFAHLNTAHLLTFIDQFELYVQAGVGNSDAIDPQVMLRYSKDGGHTWSAERWLSAGAVGEYRKRLRWLQLGQARDWVFEIVTSDSAIFNLIEAYANVRQGSS